MIATYDALDNNRFTFLLRILADINLVVFGCIAPICIFFPKFLWVLFTAGGNVVWILMLCWFLDVITSD